MDEFGFDQGNRASGQYSLFDKIHRQRSVPRLIEWALGLFSLVCVGLGGIRSLEDEYDTGLLIAAVSLLSGWVYTHIRTISVLLRCAVGVCFVFLSSLCFFVTEWVPRLLENDRVWVVSTGYTSAQTTFRTQWLFRGWPYYRSVSFLRERKIQTVARVTTIDRAYVTAELSAEISLEEDERCLVRFVQQQRGFDPVLVYTRLIEHEMAAVFSREASRRSVNSLEQRLVTTPHISFLGRKGSAYYGCRESGIPFRATSLRVVSFTIQ